MAKKLQLLKTVPGIDDVPMIARRPSPSLERLAATLVLSLAIGAFGGCSAVGPVGSSGTDGGAVVCRVPVQGSGCSMLTQMGAPVAETQVASAPPVTTAGFYPAGIYTLEAATIYTGTGGAAGPTGLAYAATISVNGTGSVDAYQVVQSQAGCPDVTYAFSGDTFATTMPATSLNTVTWKCPPCPTCSVTMPYSGTMTNFTYYLPLKDGTTLSLDYKLLHGF